MSDLDTLIRDLEEATEGSRELDTAVTNWMWREKWGKKLPKDLSIEPYTTSLDAALTLVPEGWKWEIANHAGDDDGPRAALWWGIPAEHNDEIKQIGAHGNTPALALCIAALKARNAT